MDQTKIEASFRKWLNVLIQPTDPEEATKVIVNLYQSIGYARPKIVFLKSPLEGLAIGREIDSHRRNSSTDASKDIKNSIESIYNQLIHQISAHFEDSDFDFAARFSRYLAIDLDHTCYGGYWNFQPPFYHPVPTLIDLINDACSSTLSMRFDTRIAAAAMYECAVSMGVPLSSPIFDQLSNLAGHVFAIDPFEEICFVLERPQFKFNDQGNLHAEAQPAIAFSDGTGAGYFYNGTRLPDYCGVVPFDQWKPQWVLQEKNVEIRRILIQEIGYTRLYQELRAEELNVWREYTLLRLPIYDDFSRANWGQDEPEAIYLLKMTCPSTRSIYILRVPPNVKTAREAASWVNWDIDPATLTAET